jgi:hypothetical protein
MRPDTNAPDHDTDIDDDYVAGALDRLQHTCFPTAYRYACLGCSIVPQMPGHKMPLVKWKRYQEERPSAHQLADWFYQWPNAGIAVVLGRVSGLFAIDCDGEEAHRVLIERVGDILDAPKSRSGSGEKYRYHLFYKAPDLPTNARYTPWHRKLEFRGDNGIVVLPPSLHKSGNRYRWVKQRSLLTSPLPEIPAVVKDALRDKHAKTRLVEAGPPRQVNVANRNAVLALPDLCLSTRLFLMGEFAALEGWNNRLFNAACDLEANGVSLDVAAELLLSGARPATQEDQSAAERTIASAYSIRRSRGRDLAADAKLARALHELRLSSRDLINHS